MQKSLQAHILFLEHNLQSLNEQLMRPGLIGAEYSRINAQIAIAARALANYREAYELEQTLHLGLSSPISSPATSS